LYDKTSTRGASDDAYSPGATPCDTEQHPSPASRWKREAVVKIQDVPKEEIVDILDKVEGLEILDVRET